MLCLSKMHLYNPSFDWIMITELEVCITTSTLLVLEAAVVQDATKSIRPVWRLQAVADRHTPPPNGLHWVRT